MRILPIIALGAGALLFATSKGKRNKKLDTSPGKTGGDEGVGATGREADSSADDLSDEELDEIDRALANDGSIDDAPSPKLPSGLPGREDEGADLLDIEDELDEDYEGSIYSGGHSEDEDVQEAPAYPTPPIGPDAGGERFSTIYSREPKFMTPEIANVLTANSASSLPENKFYFYLKSPVQTKLFDALVQRYEAMASGQENPSLSDSIVREELYKINSGEDWAEDISNFSLAKTLTYRSAIGLASLASINTGFSKIVGSKNENVKEFSPGPNLYTVTRESLGMPTLTMRSKSDKDLIALDQRVELLAVSEDKSRSEHIIGRIIDLSPNGDSSKVLIEIIDEFEKKDVSPRMTASHNFKPGTVGTFEKKSPSGVYRVFPKGMS